MAAKDSLVQIVKAEPRKYSKAELSRILGVSQERVRQIVNKVGLHHLVRPAYPAHSEGKATKDTAHEGGLKLRTRIFEFYPTYKCAKCEHEWMPRNPQLRKCPKCRSARWVTSKATEPPANMKYSSLVELAQAMGIANSQIYRVRRSERTINEKFIVGAMKAFPGYRLDELFYVAPDGSEQVKDE